MSRSQPKLENPCKKWIEFNSEDGIFTYYDKETEKKVEVPMPIYFTVLDELNVITGYNKRHDCGIISNEIHATNSEILRVRTFKGGESVTGYYKDIRDNIVAMGGKFTKSVYALMINHDKSTEFCNFKFKGAAFSAWLDKHIDPMKSIIGITELVEEKNGNNTYNVPVFKAFKLEPSIDAEALKYDEILQAYLKEYKAQIPEKEIAQAEAANPLIDEPAPLANKEGQWQGKSKLPPTKEELMAKAKAALITRGSGKQNTPAMSNIEDLPQTEEDYPTDNGIPDDLPF